MVNVINILGNFERNCLLTSRMNSIRYRSMQPEDFRRINERFYKTNSAKHKKSQVVNEIQQMKKISEWVFHS